MRSNPDHYYAAHRFASGIGHATWGSAQLLPTRIKSGLGTPLTGGNVHLVSAAAIATDARGARLAARWVCGRGAANVIPVEESDSVCKVCLLVLEYPIGPCVYRCYDADNELLYIGSSINLAQRIGSHASGTAWWSDAADVVAEWYPTESAARLAEAMAIAEEAPPMNRAGLRVLRGGAA